MGKTIVIRGADFSAVAVDNVPVAGGWRTIDLTQYNLVGTYLTSKGWIASSGDGWLIPINDATKLRFTANSVGKGQISLCTGTTTSGSYITDSTVTLNAGASTQDDVVFANFPTAQGIFVAHNYGSENRIPLKLELYKP